MLWVIAINWLQVIGDVASADLTGSVLSDGSLGPYRVEAIRLEFVRDTGVGAWNAFWNAIGRMAVSLDCSADRRFTSWGERGVRLHRVMLCYFVSLAVTQILGAVAASVPALAQPVLALSLIKFVCVYLIAAKVFESGRGYGWLAVVSLLEMVTGVTGYFSSYKEAFIVILIAFATSRRPMSARMWIFSATAVVAVVWVSLVWTAVKKEYRHFVVSYPFEERLEWMAQRFFVDSIDYRDAVVRLFQRIGYTEFYATVIAREDSGSLPATFTFMPRRCSMFSRPVFFFPIRRHSMTRS